MATSLGKNSLPHRGHKQVIVIAVQSIIILWLGSWAIGDYLNNIYVHAYVDASLAAYGWIMILALVGGSLGSAWTMVHRRHATIGKVEKPIKESKKSMPSLPAPTISTPTFQSSAKSGLNPKLAQLGIRTSSLSSISTTASNPEPATPTASSPVSFTQSPPASDSGFKPTAELHPAVAALKAELSERRVTLGLVTATVGQDQSPPPPTFQGQPQPSERPIPSPMETRPLQRIEQANSSQSQPPTIIRPMPSPPPMRPMQSSSPPPARPMQPFSFNRPTQPQLPGQNNSRPVLPSRPIQPGSQDRFEDAVSRAGFIPTQPSQNLNQNPQNRPAPTQIPRNVSTVITGIMPKKKDPQDPANQNASGQNSSS